MLRCNAFVVCLVIALKSWICCQADDDGVECGEYHTCWDQIIDPSVDAQVTETVNVRGEHPGSSVETYYDVTFTVASSTGYACGGVLLDFTYQHIDLDQTEDEWLHLSFPGGATFASCGGPSNDCGWTQCLESYPVASSDLVDGESITIRVTRTSRVQAFCSSEHDYAINSFLSLTCDGTLVEDPGESCGTDQTCWDLSIDPVMGDVVTTEMRIRDDDPGNKDTYYDVTFNIASSTGIKCADPAISFSFEEIDYNSASEKLYVGYPDGTAFATCGTQQYGCGVWTQCLSAFPLPTGDMPDGSYITIRVTRTAAVDDLCTDWHDYTVNAILKLTCDGSALTAIPTASPTELPSISPTKIPTMSPTLFPSSSPTELPSFSPTPLPSVSPTQNPTIDGCDFDLENYLDTCYCSSGGSSPLSAYAEPFSNVQPQVRPMEPVQYVPSVDNTVVHMWGFILATLLVMNLCLSVSHRRNNDGYKVVDMASEADF